MTALRKAWWARQQRRSYEANLKAIRPVLDRFPKPYKLHIGCGYVRFDGWINLDGDPAASKADAIWDLRHGLPAPDDSCEIIHSEHVVEHLTVPEGQLYFRECLRCLQPGGVMRVAMPSLDHILDLVQSGRWREQDWLTWPDFQHVSTRAEMLNLVFRSWEHQWVYDREELERRLRQAGFTLLRTAAWGESEHPDLRQRETRKDSLLIMEAVK